MVPLKAALFPELASAQQASLVGLDDGRTLRRREALQFVLRRRSMASDQFKTLPRRLPVFCPIRPSICVPTARAVPAPACAVVQSADNIQQDVPVSRHCCVVAVESALTAKSAGSWNSGLPSASNQPMPLRRDAASARRGTVRHRSSHCCWRPPVTSAVGGQLAGLAANGAAGDDSLRRLLPARVRRRKAAIQLQRRL